MPSIPAAYVANRLLSALPRKDLQRFLEGCEPVQLVLAEVLADPGERIQNVYFPMEGYISLQSPIIRGHRLGLGLIGIEGMLGTSLALGENVSPLHASVVGEGLALRMDATLFSLELESSPTLQQELKRYLYGALSQFALTAACHHFHMVEARLSRWLLMMSDRARSNEIYITHEFLANILGVRREGITSAAMALADRRVIRYSRGNITILTHKGLEAASCSCYAADKASYLF